MRKCQGITDKLKKTSKGLDIKCVHDAQAFICLWNPHNNILSLQFQLSLDHMVNMS